MDFQDFLFDKLREAKFMFDLLLKIVSSYSKCTQKIMSKVITAIKHLFN